MTTQTILQAPPDHEERLKALDTSASVIVEAPAGSGKTTLLTQRFLALLSRVDDPRQIVAITFTNAAAAEMRHRILDALSKAARNDAGADGIAVDAYQRSQALGWNLLEQPASLRISTIDSFCRDLAIQQPLLSGLGGSLTVADSPEDLYRKAAKQTLIQIDDGPEDLKDAISILLAWRDNSWHEFESELVKMLAKRDRWMQGFVFDSGIDEAVLRESLERPFARGVAKALSNISGMIPGNVLLEIISLLEFASANLNGERFGWLANGLALCGGYEASSVALESDLEAYRELADLLLTKEGTFRSKFTKNEGFPATAKAEKARLESVISELSSIEGFREALKGVSSLPALKYDEDEWRIVRACFVLLRYAAAKLKIVFSEVGRCDFVEIAQLAQQALNSSEGAFSVADEIRHLLVDEFQDTSRRQHRLLADLVGHWTDREDRTAFFVGDPRQSIYFFRDAEAELFPRVQNMGLEISQGDSLDFMQAKLSANFRTEPGLVEHLNGVFEQVFRVDDGSGLKHTHAVPARKEGSVEGPLLKLHLEFVPAAVPFRRLTPEQVSRVKSGEKQQLREIVALIDSYRTRIEQAKKSGKKFRIAVLGRTHKALLPIATELRAAGVPFRAIDLEPLADRPEVTDALGLARAVLNPEDRVAWLGVLRAPWCGLPLEELHRLTSADDPAVLSRPVAAVAGERLHLLSAESQVAVRRVLDAVSEAAYMRASHPTQSLGAWLEAVWSRIGGAATVNAQGRANLDLLWSVLDSLENGEQDLLGKALESALADLKAQPDPNASSSHGVQLLTIHKSKGLEFEVVIVPELHAQGGGAKLNMLSWMERGLAEEDASGDLTEFLIAPFSLKGAEGGVIKKWVDREIRDRERQEMRRLLYVAATRARDELHLFARPGYRINPEDGSRTLATPSECLLATAWPALESEVRSQFEALPDSLPSASLEANTGIGGAALVSRLPATVTISQPTFLRMMPEVIEERKSALYSRETGGTESRVLGLAVHTLLERIALLRKESLSWDEILSALPESSARVTAQMRASGLNRANADRLVKEALSVATTTIDDAHGRWVLDNHPGAESETSWTGILGSEIHTVKPDRVFLAGDGPGNEGEDFWIVDFKTAILEDSTDPAKVAKLRSLFAPQLDVYSRMLRQLHGDSAKVHVGLYYPRMKMLDSWTADLF